MLSITRLYPFFSGCGTIANHRLMKILLSDRSEELVWAQSVGGPLLVPLNDYVGRAVFLFGDLDPKITWILKRLLKPGDQALDIGANFGLLTLVMSRLVGPQGVVHAFEPNPVLRDILDRTFERNQVQNVQLHSIALGDSSGYLPLQVPPNNFGAASLVRKINQPKQTHTVSVVKLDDFIRDTKITNIAIIKLDVEGFELHVLKGASSVLQNFRPIIIYENNDATNCAFDPVTHLLGSHKYRLLVIPRSLLLMKTKVVDSQKVTSHDLVAVPQERFLEICSRLGAN